jgi:bacterial/archaeal transporter family protein
MVTTRNVRLGIAMAATCGVLTATTLLIGSRLVRTLPPLPMVACVYLVGATLHACLHFGRGRPLDAPPWRSLVPGAALVGVFDAVYNGALLSGLAFLRPPVHAFYSLLGEVFATALGIFVLRENYTRREGFAAAAVVLGLLAVRARSEGADGRGLACMIVAALAFATSAMFVRNIVRRHSPTHVAFVRTVIAAVALLTASALFGLRAPRGAEWPLVIAMGFLGPFLNGLLFYHALRHLEVGRAVMLRMTYVLLIPLGAWTLFGQPISLREALGGALMVAGALVLVRERARRAETPSPEGAKGAAHATR